MNSSRLLLELIRLADDGTPASGWDSVIRRPVMRSLMLALQYRDPAVVRHARRVACLAVGIAQYLGWEGRSLQVLEAASLLHDIGKVSIPDIVLHKPGSLAPDEVEMVALQYSIAGDVLQACGADHEVVQIVTQARYHFNGASHDFRVIGSDVHQGARILAVSDAYDSLVTPQVYRDAHVHSEAMDILFRAGGSQFDGNVIAALTRWFETGSIPQELSEDVAEHYELQPAEIIEAGSLSNTFSYLYLLESLYHGFYVTDASQRVRMWNTGCEELTGIPWSQAFAARSSGELIRYRNRFGEPLPAHERPAHLASESRRSQTTELQMQRADGDWVPVECQTIPLIGADGRLDGFAEIFRDLSGRRDKGGYRDLKLMASRDALTHVANRGELRRQLDLQMKNYRDRGCTEPFSVIFMDVDHFKRTNDTWGHAAGDEVLISVARMLQHETYSGELVARYGGEEFVVLCPETSIDAAFQKAERLRMALQTAQVVSTDEFRVTASFGVSEVEPSDSPETVLQRADKALYVSKHQGRNRSSQLTSEQLRLHDASLAEPPLAKPGTAAWTGRLRACLEADMVIYKLRAFVDGIGARLGEIQPGKVTLTLGQRGLLPFWGSTPDRQPVRMKLEIGGDRDSIQRGASRLVEIKVHMEPLGWVRDPEAFEVRVRGIMRDLREYFAAEMDPDDAD